MYAIARNSRHPAQCRNGNGGNGVASFLLGSCHAAGFIQVNWYGKPAWYGWDVHGADLPGLVRMEAPLCPRRDQGLSALLTTCII
jgi:hypothetical protein